MVYFALAQSILSYTIVLLGGISKTNLHKLEVEVNTLIKIIVNKGLFFKNIILQLMKIYISRYSIVYSMYTIPDLKIIKFKFI